MAEDDDQNLQQCSRRASQDLEKALVGSGAELKVTRVPSLREAVTKDKESHLMLQQSGLSLWIYYAQITLPFPLLSTLPAILRAVLTAAGSSLPSMLGEGILPRVMSEHPSGDQ